VLKWGKASTLNLIGYGSVYIKFKNTNKLLYLNNCVYVPEIGINLILISALDDCKINILFKS
jgi:hypothetical protein